MTVTLSILIPALPERLTLLGSLMEDLTRQAEGLPVEVLVFLDNRQRTLGTKWNALVEAAQGNYVTKVDDDDQVSATYVRDILQAIEQHPGVNCILFDVAFYLCGKFQKIFRYGQEYGWTETDDYIYREPAPFMCWQRQIMSRYKFLDVTGSEDSEWINNGPWKHETISQIRIPHVLYSYMAVPGHP